MKQKLFVIVALMPLGLALAQTAPPSTPSTLSSPTTPPTSAEVDRERGANASFQMLDGDADGRISRAEATADVKLGQRFAEVDGNRDGFLDQREYRKHARPDGNARTSASSGP